MEEINAVFSGAAKILWKRKAAEICLKACLDEKRGTAIVELNNQLVSILTEA
jgi:hypothetical protein